MCATELLSAIFAGATALFAFVMCGIVWHQTKTTKRLGRAWVMGIVGNELFPEGYEPDITVAKMWALEYRIRCHGGVARITKAAAKFVKIENLSKLPLEPDYTHAQIGIEGDVVLLPGFDFTISNLAFNDSSSHEILLGKLIVVFFGFIDYIDAAEEIHQARFCYYYHKRMEPNLEKAGFGLGGPHAYNKCT